MKNLQFKEGAGLIHHNDKILRLWEYGYLNDNTVDEDGKTVRVKNSLMGYGIDILLKNGSKISIVGMEVEAAKKMADGIIDLL